MQGFGYLGFEHSYPTGHATHDPFVEASEVVPAGQTEQLPDSVPDSVPESQRVQLTAPPVEYVPDGQLAFRLPSGAGQYFPTGHFSQNADLTDNV